MPLGLLKDVVISFLHRISTTFCIHLSMQTVLDCLRVNTDINGQTKGHKPLSRKAPPFIGLRICSRCGWDAVHARLL